MPYSYLPAETLDHIIDLLHDESETLKQCCLVSKSWVPRTRKHLFADIKFNSPSHLESWQKTFPDVGNSPAYYTRTLFVGCTRPITTSCAEEDGWIQAFSRVRSLDVNNGKQFFGGSEVSLTPFNKISPTLKSLRVDSTLVPHPGLFDLICSFPLLEDLSLEGRDRWPGTRSQTVTRSTSPALTGSLNYHVLGGAGKIARQLLELPNGLHFRKVALSWDNRTDPLWIAELVARCSHTLESLDITYTFRRTCVYIYTRTDSLTLFQVGTVGLVSGSIDLSKATKLRSLIFRPDWARVEWITTTLQTITPEHHQELQQISIYIPSWLSRYGAGIKESLGEATLGQWLDLDRLLLQFWEAHLILPKLEYVRPEGQEQLTEYCIGCLFPEITKCGVVELD